MILGAYCDKLCISFYLQFSKKEYDSLISKNTKYSIKIHTNLAWTFKKITDSTFDTNIEFKIKFFGENLLIYIYKEEYTELLPQPSEAIFHYTHFCRLNESGKKQYDVGYGIEKSVNRIST